MARPSVLVSLYDSVNDFQLLQRADAEAAAARHGLDLRVQDAAADALSQFQQLFAVIHGPEEGRPAAAILEPVSIHGLERLARSAGRAGMGLAILNSTVSFLETLREEFPRLPFFAVGTDQVEIGRIQGRQFRALLPGGGTVLYVQGPASATAATERLQGAREVLDGAGIELIVVDADWSEDGAAEAVLSWRRLSTSRTTRIDLVGAQDDPMARGARRALLEESADWRAVPFTGIDGLPAVGQRRVDQGELAATIIMPSNTGPAIDAVSEWLRTGQLPSARLLLPCEPYPRDSSLPI